MSIPVTPIFQRTFLSDYKYKSSVGETFINHFKLAAKKYIDKYNLTSNSLVIDIGSNDGIGLKYFIKKNIKVLGVEPAKNLSNLSNYFYSHLLELLYLLFFYKV